MSDVRRAIVIVLDGCGIGEAPDSADYGDAGSNSIVNTARAVGGLDCPNLAQLGLGNLDDIPGVPRNPSCTGSYGTMRERAAGKDSTSGHWELMGVTLEKPFPVYPHGFGQHILEPFARRTGRNVIGNKPASGTAIIDELGDRHVRTGDWIIYTSADSVFQIAAHEDKVSIPELYQACRIAREILIGDDSVGRVIARPFIGTPGAFVRTARRKDYSLPPPEPTLLDRLHERGIPTVGIGKIDDLFAGCGLLEKIHTDDNVHGMRETVAALNRVSQGLIFTNLVEFDMIWGHRNDPVGYARALEQFDRQLGEMLPHLTTGDAIFIVADHGCDPTTPSTDHSRELVPLLAYGPALRAGVDLGRRDTFADLAATLADIFELPASARPSGAESFWPQLRRA